MDLTVASYNILANSYIKPEWYPNADPEMLIWQHRQTPLADQIIALNADIICLQEVEPDVYHYLETVLASREYRGYYAKKRARRPDGCATFIRNTLTIVNTDTIYFRDRGKQRSDSGHLALIVAIDSAIGLIKVINNHIRWEDRPAAEHIGYREVRELLFDHISRDLTTTGWIWCGDFNAEADSETIRQIIDHGLLDAYRDHQQVTCNPNQRGKRIDYIFHSANLIAKPQPIAELDNLTPMLTRLMPSDHLPIVAKFQTKQKDA